ncbi:MAG TPA: esterase-like activity of phytase family protein [Lacipirellulaceae bacterium]|nr:esterase-like activity of phytase family protein [Lacipirellulaceae bacterium]
MTTVRWLLAAVCTLALAARGQSAPWSIERINHITLAPPAGVTIAEMSGVTYLGPVGDAHRFLAVQQTKGELLQFDLSFGVNGAIAAVSGVVPVTINGTLDFEGIAYTNPVRHSVFLSEENNPGVREINLATGLALQTVAIPSVFTSHKRANRGFESLARSQDGTVMWTANEAALTVDGPLATAAAGTVVRLLRLDVNGNSVAASSQFAYQVEPIHGSSSFGSPQSGLSELTLLPDGTLLAVERSVALTSPLYLNRIYAVDFDGATDVSVGPLAAGLTGQTYAPVSKQLLWSGAVDGASGQNMEGLALGPNWQAARGC